MKDKKPVVTPVNSPLAPMVGIYQNNSDYQYSEFYLKELTKPTRTVLMAKYLTGIKTGNEPRLIPIAQLEREIRFNSWRKLSENEIKNLHLPQLQESNLVEEVL